MRTSRESGGTTQAVLGLTRSLATRGLDVGLVTTTIGNATGLVPGASVETHTFEEGRLGRLWTGYAPGVCRFLETEVEKYDLVHIHQLWHQPHFAAYRAARRASKPYIVTPHGALSPWAISYKTWKKRIYWASIQKRILNKAAAIHALTRDEVTYFRNWGLKTHMAFIPNAIDPSVFDDLPPKSSMGELYPELTDKKVVLFLGRIHPIKGLDLLALAFSEVARRRDDVWLVLAGPDHKGHRHEIESILRAEGTLHKSLFTGMLGGRERLSVLVNSDVLVQTSYSESSSIVALEGMMCQVPLIMTRQCGFPEAAEAEVAFEIDRDPKQLAEALETLLDDPSLGCLMGEKGRKMVLDRFTWDQVAGRMHDLYSHVLEERRN